MATRRHVQAFEPQLMLTKGRRLRDVAPFQIVTFLVQVYRIRRFQCGTDDVQISSVRHHLLEGRDRGQRRPAVGLLAPYVLVERVRVVAEGVLDLP